MVVLAADGTVLAESKDVQANKNYGAQAANYAAMAAAVDPAALAEAEAPPPAKKISPRPPSVGDAAAATSEEQEPASPTAPVA